MNIRAMRFGMFNIVVDRDMFFIFTAIAVIHS